MLKYILLLINSISILFFNLFFGDGVTITPKLPANAKPNSEFVAEVVIKKGTVGGFAKLQIDLPQGLTAKELDNKGGSFTYANGAVKYIWTSLPADEEFTVKFTVMADGTCAGTKQLQGKFSYIVNNAKQQSEFGPADILFESNPTPVTTTTTNTETPVANNPTVTPNNTTTPTSTNTTTNGNKPLENFSPSKDPNVPVSVHRRISSTGNNEYTVELVIHKENIKGFAKYTDKIPVGFRASQISTNGASFSFNDQVAKFVWVSLPPSDELKVSYKLEMDLKPSQQVFVAGEFSYLENDQTQKVKSQSDEILIPSEQPVATNTVVPETSTVTPTTTTTPTNTVATTPTVTPTNTVSATPTITPTNTTSTNESTTNGNTNSFAAKGNSNVSFQVQVGAFQNAITVEKIAGLYGISDNIRTDMHEGLTKFLVGNYNDYKAARDKRENMRNKGVPRPFVTAYNSGKRITIQEALMITTQKWLR